MKETLKMREFFFNTLENLDKLTGLKQFHKLNDLENAEKEISDLLDELVKMTDRFPQIPDDAKQEIISTGIITDPEFIGFNARIIWKWLYAVRGRWLRQEEEKKQNPEGLDMTPLTGEAKQAKLKEWLGKLGPMVEKVPAKQRVAFKRSMMMGLPLPENAEPPKQESDDQGR